MASKKSRVDADDLNEGLLLQDTFYSDEASDIIGKLPSWIIRYGITLVAVIISWIVVACCFIKYPQTVDATITITTLNPPADLFARSEGRIDRIFTGDKSMVERGQPIALIYNTASYKDLCDVYDMLRRSLSLSCAEVVKERWLLKNYNLGDLQQVYETFRMICMDYRHYVITDNIGRKKTLLAAQIAKNKKYREQLAEKNRLAKEDTKYEYANERRTEKLYEKGLISKSDYEGAIRSRLQTEQNRRGSEATLTSTDLDIMQMEQQIIELDIQRDNEVAEYERQLNQCRQQLITAIEQWKYRYIIESPVSGQLTFVKYWSENQSVANGDHIASIIPLGRTEVTGRMIVPSVCFGKVRAGQTVNVRLNGFPYMEYGMLRGIIRNISSVPDAGNGYIIDVTFPDGMITTYKKKIDLIQKMDGMAQIVTEDMKLIDRFVQPVRVLF